MFWGLWMLMQSQFSKEDYDFFEFVFFNCLITKYIVVIFSAAVQRYSQYLIKKDKTFAY